MARGKRVAIVGSRTGIKQQQVVDFVNSLPEGTIVVSGGARGVDKWAEEAARVRGLEVDIYPADWNRLGKKAGMIRNRDIVKNADEVVAFWDGKSRGTKNTMELAEQAGKLITPNQKGVTSMAKKTDLPPRYLSGLPEGRELAETQREAMGLPPLVKNTQLYTAKDLPLLKKLLSNAHIKVLDSYEKQRQMAGKPTGRSLEENLNNLKLDELYDRQQRVYSDIMTRLDKIIKGSSKLGDGSIEFRGESLKDILNFEKEQFIKDFKDVPNPYDDKGTDSIMPSKSKLPSQGLGDLPKQVGKKTQTYTMKDLPRLYSILENAQSKIADAFYFQDEMGFEAASKQTKVYKDIDKRITNIIENLEGSNIDPIGEVQAAAGIRPSPATNIPYEGEPLEDILKRDLERVRPVSPSKVGPKKPKGLGDLPKPVSPNIQRARERAKQARINKALTPPESLGHPPPQNPRSAGFGRPGGVGEMVSVEPGGYPQRPRKGPKPFDIGIFEADQIPYEPKPMELGPVGKSAGRPLLQIQGTLKILDDLNLDDIKGMKEGELVNLLEELRTISDDGKQIANRINRQVDLSPAAKSKIKKILKLANEKADEIKVENLMPSPDASPRIISEAEVKKATRAAVKLDPAGRTPGGVGTKLGAAGEAVEDMMKIPIDEAGKLLSQERMLPLRSSPTAGVDVPVNPATLNELEAKIDFTDTTKWRLTGPPGSPGATYMWIGEGDPPKITGMEVPVGKVSEIQETKQRFFKGKGGKVLGALGALGGFFTLYDSLTAGNRERKAAQAALEQLRLKRSMARRNQAMMPDPASARFLQLQAALDAAREPQGAQRGIYDTALGNLTRTNMRDIA